MFSSKWEVCDSNRSRFVKKHEASGVNDLALKRPLSKIPLLGYILLWRYKMKETVNKCLLVGAKFMTEM